MKKDKASSTQISICQLIQYLSNPQYLKSYKKRPSQLADQISDIKVLVNFACSSYTSKARALISLSKSLQTSINKSTYLSLQPIAQCFPQLSYQILKKTTKLPLQIQQSQVDCSLVLMQLKLKFLQSKSIPFLKWPICYNHNLRQIQLTRIIPNHNYINTLEQFKIRVGLRIQQAAFRWVVNKIYYREDQNNIWLYKYYQQLMESVRSQFQTIEESQQHVLGVLYRSLDYVEVVLLYQQLKQKQFNSNISEEDKQNKILKIFSQQSVLSKPVLSCIPVACFLLTSCLPPQIILHICQTNLMRLQFHHPHILNLHLKYQTSQKSLKLINKLHYEQFNLKIFQKLVIQVIQAWNVFKKFWEEFRIRINLGHEILGFINSLDSINGVLFQDNNQQQYLKFVNQVKIDLQTKHLSPGFYIAYWNPLLDLRPIKIRIDKNLLLKSQNDQPGFLNKMLKCHPKMSFSDAMMHINCMNEIFKNQQNWLMKAYFMDIFRDNQSILYNFRNVQTIKKRQQQKQKRLQHKQIGLIVQISQNFKTISFKYIQNWFNQKQKVRPAEYNLPYQFFSFKDQWNQYIEQRKSNIKHSNTYLDVNQVIKAIHYAINHFDIQRSTKKHAGKIKNNQIHFMDQ